MGAWGIKALERDDGLDVLDILKNEYVPEHLVMDLGEISRLMSQSKCSDHAGAISPLFSFFQRSTISRMPSSSGTSFLMSVSCRSRKARASLDAVKPVTLSHIASS